MFGAIGTRKSQAIMGQATHAAFDARHGIDLDSMTDRSNALAVGKADIRLSIHDDLENLENDWRAFERTADCTVFQTYAWISAWLRNIGARKGVTPIVVAGRDAAGDLLFILPFAVETAGVRKLTWLASDLCDYNAPLLAPGFSRKIDAARFEELWSDIVSRLQSHPAYRYDLIQFEKMPEMVG